MKKQFLLSLFANAARVVLGFVFFWQVSQALGLKTLGEYLYITAALGYFGTLIDYGFNLFVLNTTARSEGMVRPLFLRVILSKLVLTTVSVAILSGIYAVTFAEQGLLVTTLFFLAIVLLSFSGLMIHFFKALGRFDYELASVLIGSVLQVLVMMLLHDNVTLMGLAVITLGVRIAVLIFQTVVFLRLTVGQSWTDLETVMHRLLPMAVKDIGGNFQYALFSVLGAVFLSIDVVVMRFLLGPEDVSIYGTAMKVIMAVILFFEVLTGVFIPRLARQYGRSPQQFRIDVRRFALIMLVGASALSLTLLALGPLAITVAFGVEFVEAGLVLQLLSLVLVFRVMTMVSGSLLTVYGLQAFRARVMLVILPIHLALNLLLQPHFGIWGAVGTMGCSFMLLFVLNTICLWRGDSGGSERAG